MKVFAAILLCFLLGYVLCQQAGHQTAETHPKMTWETCTGNQNCQTKQGAIVLDSNWRWTHKVDDYTNCYTGNKWDSSICPDPQTCAQNCALDGADYSGTYGVDVSGDSVKLKFVTVGQYDTNIGSRLYLLQDDENYEMFQLLGKEFTFTVDVSQLPCGLNGALYFVAMDQDGGMSKYPTNKCGAKYGTGYCDAQCPHDMKWINGEANVDDWQPSPNNPNTGTGKYGTCCMEMDIWESNSAASAVTPHTCSVKGPYRCSGSDCGDIPDNRYGGVCDKDGCDFNPWREGNQTFFGPGMTVDTTKPVTVVTQFIESGGSLSEIRRLFVQNGRVYQNPHATFSGLTQYNSVTDQYCAATKQLFGDKNDFATKGGLKAMGSELSTGMVLVMSLWDDYYAHMLWLDSDYPTDKPHDTPGISRGPCSTSSGVPSEVEKQYPNAYVTYSKIRVGSLNSTFSGTWVY